MRAICDARDELLTGKLHEHFTVDMFQGGAGTSTNMNATAIGTGLNSPPGYADLVTQKLSEVSGFTLRRDCNLVEATQNAGSFAQMSATMKRAAVQISKICNDLRWISTQPTTVTQTVHNGFILLFNNGLCATDN